MALRGDAFALRLEDVLPDAPLREELGAKRALLSTTLSGLEFTDRILHAFLLPSSLADLEHFASVLEPLTGQDILSLKRRAGAVMRDAEQLHELSTVADPLDPRSELGLLLLLESLMWIVRRVVGPEEVKSCIGTCVTIADNFGLWRIRYLLEDAAFELLQPEQYLLMSSLLERQTRKHEKFFADIEAILRHYLAKAGIADARVLFRTKNIYGVYVKCVRGKKNLNHVSDVLGLRVITDSAEDCYRALDVIHRLWPPFPGSFKDYIASPKPNGYQSLHTTVSCLEASVVEFQIRSVAMDHIANVGPASHALYKQSSRAQGFAALP